MARMPMSDSGFERAARERKALRLLSTLDWMYASDSARPTADELANVWSDASWRILAQAARVREPSLETRALVVRMLREREQDACRCFVRPAAGERHESACPLALAEARARRAS